MLLQAIYLFFLIIATAHNHRQQLFVYQVLRRKPLELKFRYGNERFISDMHSAKGRPITTDCSI